MSREATEWAADFRPPHPADKSVLWALAHAHNRHKKCAYPSVAAIVEFTGWQRKVVLASLARLTALGVIEDSGQRMGKTRQIKVWRLAFDSERVSGGHPLPDAKESLSTILSAA
ncbi:MAG: hypothetical protein PGN16_03830 [Sphingomonas phyllosphaerae]|uniref:hypothetical protein n=1 Tax=Sphingomonas phyllosphaerae TaxID=257003 RepID=UPI002FF49579